ncbi:MAG: hypothetical protein M0Z94_09055 [Dehalococcoidales bacterium]|nr:hypothetical protein [Dehalococcoidales bacterium]
MSNAQSPARLRRIRLTRLALTWLIAAALLWVALLPAPPLPQAVHTVLRAVLGHHSQASPTSPPWLETALRKAPEALLYFLMALLLQARGRRRIWTFLGVSAYGLALELLRPLHGRAFEGLDVGYEALAALIGVYVPSWFMRRTAADRDRQS